MTSEEYPKPPRARCGGSAPCIHPIGCGGVCMAVRGHGGPHGCAHACRQAIAIGAMRHYLARGEYVQYQLVGDNDV